MAKKTYATGNNVSAQAYTLYTGKCSYHGFRIGMDGTNDVSLTIADGTGGTEILPTNTYDASSLGLNGEVLPDQASITCEIGLVATITCTGTFELVAIYNPII